MVPGRFHFVWLLLSCLAFASCVERGVSVGEDRPGRKRGPGEACSVDLECGELLRCEPGRRVCVCTSNLACPQQICDPFTGLCSNKALGCGSNHACQEGQWCDLLQRTCRPIKGFCEPCEDDPECGAGAICLQVGTEKFCSRTCRQSNDCPWTSARVGCFDGTCQPEISCADSAPCVPDRNNRCSTDRDCAAQAGQRCDPERSVCVAVRSGCLVGEVCDAETLVCRSPCSSNDGCPMGESCRGCGRGEADCQGVCEPTPTCGRDRKCPSPLVCRFEPGASEGICIPPCAEHGDCPIGEICSWQGGQRICTEGCATHGDCALHQICDPETARCVEAEGRCQIAATCGTCELCDGGNRCVPATGEGHCLPCGGDDECGGGLCEAGRCLRPCGEKGCPAGFGCEARMTPDGVIRVCTPSGTDCPTACG